MPPDDQELPISRRWETDGRYYLAHQHKDLFGGWVLTTAWRSKRTNLGNLISKPVPSYGAGLTELHRLSLLRAKHGYRSCDPAALLTLSAWGCLAPVSHYRKPGTPTMRRDYLEATAKQVNYPMTNVNHAGNDYMADEIRK